MCLERSHRPSSDAGHAVDLMSKVNDCTAAAIDHAVDCITASFDAAVPLAAAIKQQFRVRPAGPLERPSVSRASPAGLALRPPRQQRSGRRSLVQTCRNASGPTRRYIASLLLYGTPAKTTLRRHRNAQAMCGQVGTTGVRRHQGSGRVQDQCNTGLEWYGRRVRSLGADVVVTGRTRRVRPEPGQRGDHAVDDAGSGYRHDPGHLPGRVQAGAGARRAVVGTGVAQRLDGDPVVDDRRRPRCASTVCDGTGGRAPMRFVGQVKDVVESIGAVRLAGWVQQQREQVAGLVERMLLADRWSVLPAAVCRWT